MGTTKSASAASASPAKEVAGAPDAKGNGLSNEEAQRRLQKDGPNEMPDTALHPLQRALRTFWAPVPWMLEGAIVLELVLGKYLEAAIIAALLVFNAVLGLFQESRAQATLAAVMVTGDAAATAAIVARAVGLDGVVCPPGPIPQRVHPEQYAVYAGVLPEDKYKLVQAFQKGGHIVGMCGDGANDAPALRQAQIGIAVSTATDVARSAAGMVLTQPGLGGIVAAVKAGRVTFQRILTYTLNSLTKKIVQVLFLAVGLIMTGHAILTPLLMVLIMITGDFLGMSLTTDNVRGSPKPNSWQIGRLTVAGLVMGLGELVFCTAVLVFGAYRMGYDIGTLRTLAFVVIVFGNQATTYNNRERRHLWASRPSFWLATSSVIDIGTHRHWPSVESP